MSANLISVPCILKKNYRVEFHSDEANIFRSDGTLSMQATRRGDLFHVNIHSETCIAPTRFSNFGHLGDHSRENGFSKLPKTFNGTKPTPGNPRNFGAAKSFYRRVESKSGKSSSYVRMPLLGLNENQVESLEISRGEGEVSGNENADQPAISTPKNLEVDLEEQASTSKQTLNIILVENLESELEDLESQSAGNLEMNQNDVSTLESDSAGEDDDLEQTIVTGDNPDLSAVGEDGISSEETNWDNDEKVTQSDVESSVLENHKKTEPPDREDVHDDKRSQKIPEPSMAKPGRLNKKKDQAEFLKATIQEPVRKSARILSKKDEGLQKKNVSSDKSEEKEISLLDRVGLEYIKDIF